MRILIPIIMMIIITIILLFVIMITLMLINMKSYIALPSDCLGTVMAPWAVLCD